MSARKAAWMQRAGRRQPAPINPAALPQNQIPSAPTKTQAQLPTTHLPAAAATATSLGGATTTANVATASNCAPPSRGGSTGAHAYHAQQSAGGRGVPHTTAAAPNYPAVSFEPIVTPRTYGAMHAITHDYEVDRESDEFESDESDLNNHESDELESDQSDLNDSDIEESNSNDDDSNTLDFEDEHDELNNTTTTIPDIEAVDVLPAVPTETNVREMALRDPTPIFARYGATQSSSPIPQASTAGTQEVLHAAPAAVRASHNPNSSPTPAPRHPRLVQYPRLQGRGSASPESQRRTSAVATARKDGVDSGNQRLQVKKKNRKTFNACVGKAAWVVIVCATLMVLWVLKAYAERGKANGADYGYENNEVGAVWYGWSKPKWTTQEHWVTDAVEYESAQANNTAYC
jgi:hypothetical protein